MNILRYIKKGNGFHSLRYKVRDKKGNEFNS